MAARGAALVLVVAGLAACGDPAATGGAPTDTIPSVASTVAGTAPGSVDTTTTLSGAAPASTGTTTSTTFPGFPAPGGTLPLLPPVSPATPRTTVELPPLDYSNRADRSSPVGAVCWAMWEGAVSPMFRLMFGDLDPAAPPDTYFGAETDEFDPVAWAAYVAEMQAAVADVPAPLKGIDRAIEALAPYRGADPFAERMAQELAEIRVEVIALGDDLDAETWNTLASARFAEEQMATWPGYDDFQRRSAADPQACGAPM